MTKDQSAPINIDASFIEGRLGSNPTPATQYDHIEFTHEVIVLRPSGLFDKLGLQFDRADAADVFR